MEPNQDLNNQNPITPAPEPVPQPTPGPTLQPEAQPAPQPEPAPQPVFQAQNSVVEEAGKPAKPAKSKTLITLIVILVVLVLGAIGFGVWAIIDANQKPVASNPAEPATNEPTDPTDPSEPVAEEVELTDANIIKDLDQKIAWLNITDDTNPTFLTKYGHPERHLYEEGFSIEKYGQFVVRRLLENQSRAVSSEEIAALKASYPEYSNLDFSNIKAVDFDTFNNRYIDLFGKEFDDTTPNEIGCPQFRYDKAIKLVFDITNGCGDGMSPFYTFFSKAKYTTTDNNVYVYINAVSVDYETGNIYCDAITWWDEGKSEPEPCGALGATVKADADTYETYKEYGDRTTYRFVFKKADNGTYYFEKVEKVSE